MEIDQVATVEIDQEGRLHIVPATQEFPYVYREAMEVSWDPARRTLNSPVPREWSYGRWFRQILAASSAQGVQLAIGPGTQWVNVPDSVRVEVLEAAAHAA
ncbi:hypothetical protein [Lysobacter sp. A289]